MNRRLLTLAFGIAVGYVLGARDGRGRYDQMTAQFDRFWNSPRVARTRRQVEAYARKQGPVVLDRAEAAVKAAPAVVAGVAKDAAETARDAAERVAATAKTAAGGVSATARDVAGKVSSTARDVGATVSTTSRSAAGSVASTAKDLGARASETGRDVADRVGVVASDVRDQAGKVAADLRDRGEAAVDTAVLAAGEVRDNALASIDDADDEEAEGAIDARPAGDPTDRSQQAPHSYRAESAPDGWNGS